jgi:hypothetical protein
MPDMNSYQLPLLPGFTIIPFFHFPIGKSIKVSNKGNFEHER